MRLIDVETLQVQEFTGEVGRGVPSYAILSHTWGEDEVSLKDLQEGQVDHLKGYAKIKGCCDLAAAEGFRYAWVDTCCIDKTSSSELSEAINSMFKWYRNSSICFAYLSDVDSSQDPHDAASSFAQSRWFTRGWTLQELLAPTEIVFFGSDWGEIGTKRNLAEVIAERTRINRPALSAQEWSGFSIAQKMSWAAGRQTTRDEDEAYCLMGLFDVNMPLLYGEGRKAFFRLQEEIMKNFDDQSIFAWTYPAEKQSHVQYSGLLAPSPDFFRDSSQVALAEEFSTREYDNHFEAITRRIFRVRRTVVSQVTALRLEPTAATEGVPGLGIVTGIVQDNEVLYDAARSGHQSRQSVVFQSEAGEETAGQGANDALSDILIKGVGENLPEAEAAAAEQELKPSFPSIKLMLDGETLAETPSEGHTQRAGLSRPSQPIAAEAPEQEPSSTAAASTVSTSVRLVMNGEILAETPGLESAVLHGHPPESPSFDFVRPRRRHGGLHAGSSPKQRDYIYEPVVILPLDCAIGGKRLAVLLCRGTGAARGEGVMMRLHNPPLVCLDFGLLAVFGTMLPSTLHVRVFTDDAAAGAGADAWPPPGPEEPVRDGAREIRANRLAERGYLALMEPDADWAFDAATHRFSTAGNTFGASRDPLVVFVSPEGGSGDSGDDDGSRAPSFFMLANFHEPRIGLFDRAAVRGMGRNVVEVNMWEASHAEVTVPGRQSIFVRKRRLAHAAYLTLSVGPTSARPGGAAWSTVRGMTASDAGSLKMRLQKVLAGLSAFDGDPTARAADSTGRLATPPVRQVKEDVKYGIGAF
jgi:hypothetical protein